METSQHRDPRQRMDEVSLHGGGRPGPVLRWNPKTRERSVDQLVWGLLPHDTEDPANALRPIMARAETVATNPTFASAFRSVCATGSTGWRPRSLRCWMPIRSAGTCSCSAASARDYLKILYWDGTGLCLFAKRLENGRFVWPPIVDGAMVLTPAQLALLLEAIDWRRTVAPEPPRRPMTV